MPLLSQLRAPNTCLIPVNTYLHLCVPEIGHLKPDTELQPVSTCGRQLVLKTCCKGLTCWYALLVYTRPPFLPCSTETKDGSAPDEIDLSLKTYAPGYIPATPFGIETEGYNKLGTWNPETAYGLSYCIT